MPFFRIMRFALNWAFSAFGFFVFPDFAPRLMLSVPVNALDTCHGCFFRRAQCEAGAFEEVTVCHFLDQIRQYARLPRLVQKPHRKSRSRSRRKERP